MRHVTLALVCLLAGSLLFAPPVAAQAGDLAASAPARRAELLSPPAAEAAAPSAAAPSSAASASGDAAGYGSEESTYALPAVQICPSNFREILPTSYLFRGLLELLLLGMALAARATFRRKITRI